MMRRVLAILRLRCPRCLQGRVFRGLWRTNERCAVCGLVIEREPGYFIGAMYASYGFGLLTTAYWLPMLLMGVDPVIVTALPVVHLVVQTPIAFRYSRVIWLHVDHSLDPTRAAWDATPP